MVLNDQFLVKKLESINTMKNNAVKFKTSEAGSKL